MSAHLPQEQSEEIEALAAIFGEEFTDISSQPPCFMIKLSGLDMELSGGLSMKVLFPPAYPNVTPVIQIPLRSTLISLKQRDHLIEHLNQVAKDNIGMAMVFTLVEDAKQWIEASMTCEEKSDDEDAGTMARLDPAILGIEHREPKITGGRWDFTIGLVGKPSAGKSTFFNAATSQDMAKTAVHPFTTIEPNIGKGWYSIPCPCAKLSDRCNAAYGHNFRGERLVPVLLKDVAGLVPGACEGKGKGNRFLNDLLDADVLMHIIDVSGCTDEKGEATTGYDPCQDVMWLQEEIKHWIIDNILEKWDTIKKRPTKLIDMFTGYHANQAIIHVAFQAAGISDKELSNLPNWEKDMLDRLVQHFLQIRFPIYLVLNKCDLPNSRTNIEKIYAQFPDAPCLPVSAKLECELQHLNKCGLVQYDSGASEFNIEPNVGGCREQTELMQISRLQNLLSRLGSTNVHQALNMAVKMRQPTYAFPVQCLDTYTSIDKYKGEPPTKLRDCLSLKPHTTVEELYNVMIHYPVCLLAGDFIRAEGLNEDFNRKILRKDEEISSTNTIIKVMTTRKVSPTKCR